MGKVAERGKGENVDEVAREEAEVFGRDEKDGAGGGCPVAAEGSKDSVEPGFKRVRDLGRGVAVFFAGGGPLKRSGVDVVGEPGGREFVWRIMMMVRPGGRRARAAGGGAGPCFQAECAWI